MSRHASYQDNKVFLTHVDLTWVGGQGILTICVK